MAWFFAIAPYVLAAGAIALGAFEIIKDWKDYEGKWLRMSVAGVFIVVAVVSIASLHHDNTEKANAAKKADADMRALQGKVDTANQAQTNNTKLFLDSLHVMSDEVSQLKTEVKTEALQKKLASVQAELQNTQKALAPGPKAELSLSLPVKSGNLPVGKPPVLVTEATLPRMQDGSVRVEFVILNPTTVDVKSRSANLWICDKCKFATEPAGTVKAPGMTDAHRFFTNFPSLLARESTETYSVDVIPPAGALTFMIGFTYRCHPCVLHEEVSSLIIHIAQ
jgi:hypothetical protein